MVVLSVELLVSRKRKVGHEEIFNVESRTKLLYCLCFIISVISEIVRGARRNVHDLARPDSMLFPIDAEAQ